MIEIKEEEYNQLLKYKDRDKKLREYLKKYLATPKGKFQLLRNNARSRKIEFKLTSEEFVDWFSRQSKICFYCGITLNEGNGVREINSMTVDRCDNNKGYTLDNIVLCCIRCNKIKSNDLTKSEMTEIGKIFQKNRNLNG